MAINAIAATATASAACAIFFRLSNQICLLNYTSYIHYDKTPILSSSCFHVIYTIVRAYAQLTHSLTLAACFYFFLSYGKTRPNNCMFVCE